jgi:mono/diheme cytochrome c family protein
MTRVGDLLARLGRGRPRSRRRLWLVAGSLVTLAVVGACDSTNTYPIDFFSEMHYQKSWHAQEPPRLDSPAGAIPVTAKVASNLAYVGQTSSGPGPNYTRDEAKGLTNPLPADQARQQGQQLFTINCTACHGQQGLGGDTPTPAKSDALMVVYFQARNQQQPPDQQYILPFNLTSDAAKALTDGEIYWILTNGLTPAPGDNPQNITQMPAFGNLLTPEQRWALVAYVRQLQGK